MEEPPHSRGDPKLFGSLGFRDYNNEAEKRCFTDVKAKALEAVPELGLGRNFVGTPESLRPEHVDRFVAQAEDLLKSTPFSYLSHLFPCQLKE